MTNVNTRTNTWSEIGTNVANSNNLEEVLKNASLDYNVVGQPIFTEFGKEKIKLNDKVAMVRENDGHVYGIVSERYVPMQNKDAFDFINYIDEDIKFVKAGETNTGLVYIIGELNEMNVLGDKFKTHVIFQNSHNGRYQLAMSICPLRIVCQNQFNIAFKESNSTFLIRHTKNIDTKLRIAADALSEISNYMKIFNEKAELFAKQKITESKLTQFMNFMFPTNEKMSEHVLESVEEEKAKFIKAYMNEDNRNFQGTAWGLINGVTDYITHKDFKRKVENAAEKKFVETIINADKLNQAINYISAVA